MEENKDWIVTVTYIGEEDIEDIDDEDHTCEGSFSYTGESEEEVLDKFHDDNPMGNPELYEITVELDKEED